ncbi:MAG: hypothetical protein ACOYNZ_18410 [Rhodoferax sp.]
MTVQRFLILNQPTRAAFLQDFGVHKSGHTTPSLDAHQAGSNGCPIRLSRFARVLREPVDSFRYCHISQFSKDAGRYFGDFAVCPQCLGEGFHSVLFSFKALRECPVHRTEFWCRNGDKTIPSPRLFNELLKPYVRYGREQQYLEYATARLPKTNAQRDGALGEIANWLMDIGLRYWIGTAGLRAGDAPLQEFTEHIVHLKTAMGLAGTVPSWVAASDVSPFDPSTMEIAKFGRIKVSAKCVHDKDDWGTNRQNIDLNLYYKTLVCDFKAIQRYVKRQIPAKARRWLARLSVVVDAPDVGELLLMCGPDVRTAWAFVLWRRAVREHGFDSKARLGCRPYWLALDPAIPTWGGKFKPNPSLTTDPDPAHLWLVRWISAAGLLRFWRSLRDGALLSKQPLTAIGIRGCAASLQPCWGLAISATNTLTLCISNETPGALVQAGTLL